MCRPPDKKVMDEASKRAAPPRKAMHLLRYASAKDWCQFLAAMLVVVISGFNQPAQRDAARHPSRLVVPRRASREHAPPRVERELHHRLIIFGRLMDSFQGDDVGKAVRLVHFFALL